jgi:hypothetical protein
MKKSAPVVGIAIAALALTVGLSGCGSDKKDQKPSTSASTSAASSSSKSSSSPTSTQAGAKGQTLQEYLESKKIQSTKVESGGPGVPTVNLPPVDGWNVKESEKDPTITFGAASDPNDPPTIQAALVKLEGGDVNVDEVLDVASNEVKNLPGFSGNDGKRSTLGSYPASQISGSYTQDGKPRLAGQKTVVIESGGGTFVLQLSAVAPDADKAALSDAMNVIDDQTTIET